MLGHRLRRWPNMKPASGEGLLNVVPWGSRDTGAHGQVVLVRGSQHPAGDVWSNNRTRVEWGGGERGQTEVWKIGQSML